MAHDESDWIQWKYHKKHWYKRYPFLFFLFSFSFCFTNTLRSVCEWMIFMKKKEKEKRNDSLLNEIHNFWIECIRKLIWERIIFKFLMRFILESSSILNSFIVGAVSFPDSAFHIHILNLFDCSLNMIFALFHVLFLFILLLHYLKITASVEIFFFGCNRFSVTVKSKSWYCKCKKENLLFLRYGQTASLRRFSNCYVMSRTFKINLFIFYQCKLILKIFIRECWERLLF